MQINAPVASSLFVSIPIGGSPKYGDFTIDLIRKRDIVPLQALLQFVFRHRSIGFAADRLKRFTHSLQFVRIGQPNRI